MTTLSGHAPAKINLTLHVTGQRPDGYHELDSLVVFGDIADTLTVGPAPDLRLSVSGQFKDGLPLDGGNIVMKAARLLQERRGVTEGAAITLEKALPHAAGLGSGSSDAATVLRLLAELWQVAPLKPDDPGVLALGADVPVCMHAPAPVRMSGIGEVIQSAPRLPGAALVLVNPKLPVPTQEAFAALTQKQNTPMEPLPEGADVTGFAAWLARQRNDLQEPAIRLAPAIGAALDRMRAMPAVKAVGMSGSGATCFALVATMADARHVARVVQVAEMGWWVAPAAILR